MSSSRPGLARNRTILAAALVIAGTILTGCGSSAATPASAPAKTAAAYTVTITNYGTSVTYTRAPQRAVSNDINTTEDMLALGLRTPVVIAASLA